MGCAQCPSISNRTWEAAGRCCTLEAAGRRPGFHKACGCKQADRCRPSVSPGRRRYWLRYQDKLESRGIGASRCWSRDHRIAGGGCTCRSLKAFCMAGYLWSRAYTVSPKTIDWDTDKPCSSSHLYPTECRFGERTVMGVFLFAFDRVRFLHQGLVDRQGFSRCRCRPCSVSPTAFHPHCRRR